jgi:hypothetical protein
MLSKNYRLLKACKKAINRRVKRFLKRLVGKACKVKGVQKCMLEWLLQGFLKGWWKYCRTTNFKNAYSSCNRHVVECFENLYLNTVAGFLDLSCDMQALQPLVPYQNSIYFSFAKFSPSVCRMFICWTLLEGA